MKYEDMTREQLIDECKRLHDMAYFTIKLPTGLKWLSNANDRYGGR